MSYKPPFEITDKILTEVADIGELVGKVSFSGIGAASPTLRRENRIRSVYSSLAIEQNSLSLEQVTAVLAGKQVIAPPKDIVEVKNAYEIYEHMDMLDPYSVDSLLKAHGVMTRGTVEESGVFRAGPVGVVDNKGNILHFGTLPQYVPELVDSLLNWVKTSQTQMLVKSCVFHYEFELIHPFADGNGRMGRLWHTLLLSKWNPVFSWLPVESIVHDHQGAYYAAINASNNAGSSTVFIEFMLAAIQEALEQALEVETAGAASNGIVSKQDNQWSVIMEFLRSHDSIMNSDVQRILAVSPSTATRVLNRLTAEGKMERIRAGSHWAYRET